ncbi:hypothetical protein LCGC14_0225290 [marine sediment metagenome]|uniref:Uncharacterized protein n=1 Tax=marine sediment metagenome TaxID=412755 RepID=A0A0F9UCN9_9ZZZZ
MKVIDDERIVERIYIKNFYSFVYVPSEEVYRLHCEIAKEYDVVTKEYDDISDDFIESPAYAFTQFTRDILQLGDLTHMVETVYNVDKKLDKLMGEDGNFIPSTENIIKLNEIFVSVWDIRRNKNSRTSPVICHRVWDFATASEDGDGRCYVTGKYVHQPDGETMQICFDEAKKNNTDIVFQSGYATALVSRGNFVSSNPVLINDRPTLVGCSVINSEFKSKKLVITGYVCLPDEDIELVIRTVELSIALKHVGDPEVFKETLVFGVKKILGKSDLIANLFGNLTTCESRGVAIEFDAVNEDGKNALGLQLKMSNKMNDLIKIKESKGYPSTLEGVAYTVMDWASSMAETEAARMTAYDNVMRILRQPDTFVSNLGKSISRADVIEFDDDDSQKDLVQFI